MFSVGCWDFNPNSTLMIYFFSFIRIIGRNVSCGSIMVIQLVFIIMCSMIVWFLSMIIIGDNGRFLRMPKHYGLFSLNQCDWCSINIQKTIINKNTLINKLYSWYIFNFTYYWPAFQKMVFPPIGKYFYLMQALFQLFKCNNIVIVSWRIILIFFAFVVVGHPCT